MQDIKSILLHVDATPASLTRLEVTRHIAARLDARITALYGAEADPEGAVFSYSAGALLAKLDESEEPFHLEAKRRLQRSADHPGPQIDWCDVVGDSVTHGFLEEAAYADLVVVGQSMRERVAGSPPPGFTESMILESGRPTLVMPYAPRSGSVGRRVLVAWDGSAPAARALTGSLPFLHRADEVHVVSWSDRRRAAPFSRVDIGRYLRDHCIAPTLHLRPATKRVADELVLLATNLDADLVVMGCYGHSRARERIFGGASRGTLAEMPAPLLMAH
jgi:nucleotide-binding universal stress UspA family protein